MEGHKQIDRDSISQLMQKYEALENKKHSDSFLFAGAFLCCIGAGDNILRYDKVNLKSKGNAKVNDAMLQFVISFMCLFGMWGLYRYITKSNNPFKKWNLVSCLKVFVVSGFKAASKVIGFFLLNELYPETKTAIGFSQMFFLVCLEMISKCKLISITDFLPLVSMILTVACYVIYFLGQAKDAGQDNRYIFIAMITPIMSALSALLNEHLINNDFQKYNFAELGFIFNFMFVMWSLILVPIDSILSKGGFEGLHMTDFIPCRNWSFWTILYFILGVSTNFVWLKIAHDAELKTLAGYGGHILKVIVSYCIWTKSFHALSFLLLLSIFLLALTYKVQHSSKKQQNRMELIELEIMKHLNENVESALRDSEPELYERIQAKILQRSENLETQTV